MVVAVRGAASPQQPQTHAASEGQRDTNAQGNKSVILRTRSLERMRFRRRARLATSGRSSGGCRLHCLCKTGSSVNLRVELLSCRLHQHTTTSAKLLTTTTTTRGWQAKHWQRALAPHFVPRTGGESVAALENQDPFLSFIEALGFDLHGGSSLRISAGVGMKLKHGSRSISLP